MSYLDHAKSELQHIGWLDKDFNVIDDETDGPNYWIIDNLYELLKTLENQHHSGFSRSWIMYLFSRCANFDPLSNLTGDSNEWVSVTNHGIMFQNKRCGHIFYNGLFAYDLDGYVFRKPYFNEETGEYSTSTFTNIYSRRLIEFPFDPVVEGKPVYVAIPEDCPRDEIPYWIKQVDLYYINLIELEEKLNNNIVNLCHNKLTDDLVVRDPNDYKNRILDLCLTGK